MAFKKIDTTARPPRHWALVGHPGGGKSTLAAQMAGPILVIDADHRFQEVAGLAGGDVYEVSGNPADHVDAGRIAQLLTANMPGAGVRTVVIDSLTSIIAPLVTQAVMENDAGLNKNRVAAFKAKALALRCLQDAVTRWGVDTLWIYHLRAGMDGNARQVESTSISTVELARLRRSLNLQLRIVQEGEKRGVKVEWARRGRQGLTLWDESGVWRGMPERIEVAVYDGLSKAEQDAIEKRTPKSFASVEDAIAWGYESGAFRDALHAKSAYEKLKTEKQPKTAQQMWDCWVDDVTARQQLDTDPEEERQRPVPPVAAPSPAAPPSVPGASATSPAKPASNGASAPSASGDQPSRLDLLQSLADLLYGEEAEPSLAALCRQHTAQKRSDPVTLTPDETKDVLDSLRLRQKLHAKTAERWGPVAPDVLRKNCLRVSDFFTDSDAEISDEQVETLLHGIAILNANDAAKETAKGELP